MKPHLRLRDHIWDCFLPDWRQTKVCGWGYTPTEAYLSWQRSYIAWQLEHMYVR